MKQAAKEGTKKTAAGNLTLEEAVELYLIKRTKQCPLS